MAYLALFAHPNGMSRACAIAYAMPRPRSDRASMPRLNRRIGRGVELNETCASPGACIAEPNGWRLTWVSRTHHARLGRSTTGCQCRQQPRGPVQPKTAMADAVPVGAWGRGDSMLRPDTFFSFFFFVKRDGQPPIRFADRTILESAAFVASATRPRCRLQRPLMAGFAVSRKIQPRSTALG